MQGLTIFQEKSSGFRLHLSEMCGNIPAQALWSDKKEKDLTKQAGCDILICIDGVLSDAHIFTVYIIA